MKRKHHILTLLTLTCATASLSAANPADTNGDKKISWDEFQTVHKQRAAENGKEYNEQQTKYIFEDKDRNGDGVLTYKEFGTHPDDLNGDKSISYEEWVAMHKKRGERSGKMPNDKWVEEAFAKKDTDGDGVLSFKELSAPLK